MRAHGLAGLCFLSWLAAPGCGDDDAAGGADAAPADAFVESADAHVATGGGPYPAPGDFGPLSGPGGPTRTFGDAELYVNCAFLDGEQADPTDHHNLAVMFDGYLVLPFAPEFGTSGGLGFFEITDPCNPVVAGITAATSMRETHSIGFMSHGRRYAVTGMIRYGDDPGGGILFWDVTVPAQATELHAMALPGFGYPDAYARPTLSNFWQAPYVFVAGADNGIYVVDATTPSAPRLVTQVPFTPTLRAGQVQVVGNLLMVSAAEGARTVLLDVSDPDAPQPIPGGDFSAVDGAGEPTEAYFSTMANGYVYYARKDSGGGVIVMDIHDPTTPVYAGDYHSSGNGGYVFVKDELAFAGEGSFASIYDLTDLGAIAPVAQLGLVGDLDTITPIGNVVVLSVDADAEKDKGSAIAPYQEQPDTRAPRVTWAWPPPGSTALPVTSRIGVTLSEFVEPRSAFAGSVRLFPTGGDQATERVNGWISVQETIVNFWPYQPLAPGTEYTFEIPAGGLTDYNGNAIEEAFSMTFTTAGP